MPSAKITKDDTFSIVSDYLGTPCLMYNSVGNLVWQADLDIYGKVRTLGKGNINDCPFRYQGQYHDTEVDLYYNRFRYYSPESGMYISQDPIRLFGGSKMYAYVSNPNLLIDVLGLAKCSVELGDGVTHDLVLSIKRSDYPETTRHIEDAISEGRPNIVTIDRLLAKSNRADSLRGIPTRSGFDRDEWPMAMFREGGIGASVRHINPSDNRGAGSAIGNALSSFDEGMTVRINIID